MTDITRRTFGASLLGALAAAPALASEDQAPGRVRIGRLSELETGEPVMFTWPEPHLGILVKLDRAAEFGVGPNDSVVAYHVACPHMGCPILSTAKDRLAKGEFGPCGCHESLFDLTAHGRQIYGRASQDLVRVELEVSGDDVYATGVVGVPFGEALRLPR